MFAFEDENEFRLKMNQLPNWAYFRAHEKPVYIPLEREKKPLPITLYACESFLEQLWSHTHLGRWVPRCIRRSEVRDFLSDVQDWMRVVIALGMDGLECLIAGSILSCL